MLQAYWTQQEDYQYEDGGKRLLGLEAKEVEKQYSAVDTADTVCSTLVTPNSGAYVRIYITIFINLTCSTVIAEMSKHSSSACSYHVL